MADIFDDLDQVTPSAKSKVKSDIFDDIEKEESTGKKALRTAAQVPLGVLASQPASYIPSSIGTGLGLLATLGSGREELKNQIEASQDYPEYNPPFDVDVAEKARQQTGESIAQSLPTQRNLERFIEQQTGLPLEPKTRIQKSIRLGTESGSFKTGDLGSKATAAVVAPGISQTLQEFGVNEGISDFIGGLLSQFGRSKEAKTPELSERLSNNLGNPPPPGSDFDTGKKVQDFLRGSDGPPPPPAPTPPKPIVPKPAAPSNTSLKDKNIKPSTEELFFKPEPLPKAPSVSERIGNVFSKDKVYNKTQGGYLIKKTVHEADVKANAQINDLYRKSRELNRGISAPQPELVDALEDSLAAIERIPDPSNTQNALAKSLKNILDELVYRTKDGDISGYKTINNQTLIDQLQSLRSKAQYDFEHGEAKNIYKPTINAVKKAAADTSEAYNPNAFKALKEANTAYAEWAEIFDNDVIRNIRNKSNENYEDIFKKQMSIDDFNRVKPILEQTPEGKKLSDAIIRDMVESKLGPLVKEGKAANPDKLNEAIRDLEAVITPEQASAVRRQIETYGLRRKATRLESKLPEAQPSPEYVAASKYLKMSPEQVSAKLDSISGLNEIEKLMSKTPAGESMFAKLKEEKGINALYEGKIKPGDKTDSIQKMLNDVNKRAYLEHTLGKDKITKLEKIIESQAEIETLVKKLKEFDSKALSTESWGKFLGPNNIKHALTTAPRFWKKQQLKSLLKSKNLDILSELSDQASKTPNKIEFKSNVVPLLRRFSKELED
jgi:hypothetical protein